MNEYLINTANNFDLEAIFAARRQRELPIRNFLYDLLVQDGIQFGREVSVNRIDLEGQQRFIDLVRFEQQNHFQLGHYTLAQYGNGNNGRPITAKLELEIGVFNSIDLPPDNRFLIYATTDVIDGPEITDQDIFQYPLLAYFRNTNHYVSRDNKLNARNAEIAELQQRQDITYLGSFERQNANLIGGRFHATVFLDYFQLS